ncbi:MAG: hypothetical protein WC807_18480 [Hyphomicrobium sp.]
MAKPAKKLPKPEDATLSQIENEVAAAATWAKRMGFHNIAERLEWASTAILERNFDKPLSE